MLCGMDEDGDCDYTAEGIMAIANAMRVSRSLNVVDTRYNGIDGEAAKELAAAALASSSMITFGEVPIKELRADARTADRGRLRGARNDFL